MLPEPRAQRRRTSSVRVISKTFSGTRLFVIGGTGFLGKVWLSLILDRYPDLGKMYLAYLRDPSGNKICALHRMG